MPPVPLLKPREVIQTFEKLGWRLARQKGSHLILIKAGHPASLSVPNHRQVARGTLRALIDRAGLTVDQFLEAMED